MIETLYVITTGLTKISILLFYKRVTSTASLIYVWAIRMSIIFVTAYAIAFIFVIFLSCEPISAFWNQMDPLWARRHEWSCIDEAITMLSASITSAVQDLLAWGMPLILLSKLHISKGQRIACGLMFGIGFWYVL